MEEEYLQEINRYLSYPKIKEGDIKVDSQEYSILMDMVLKYRDKINQNMEEKVSESDDEFITYMYNKYIVLGNLRLEQKRWYDLNKLVEKSDFPEEEKEKLRDETWAYYIKSKTERENLQKLIDAIARKFDNENNK